MAAASAVAQHQTLPFPADLPGPDPPALSPAEALYRFARGEFGDDDADLYEQLHSLEKELDLLEDREEKVRIEMGDLRKEVRRCEAELTRVQEARTLVVGHLDDVVGDDHAVVTIPETGSTLCVRVLSTVDRALLVPSADVLLPAASPATIVGVLPAADAAAASRLLVADDQRPGVTYDDVAGCEDQKREVREAVELPLAHPELFARLGVDPPRGVLLHGPPGTGKTMLARAVARRASAAFLRVGGAELAGGGGGRFLGEGPRMVRDVFRLARAKAPCVVFIDEADAVGAAARPDGAATGADREARRVLVELLAQMDGFDGADDGVRVIMATNRADALDPALLRPGRLDRKVEFTLPDARQKRLVFRACAAGMSLDADVDLDELAARHERMSAADIAAVCFEAGMRAVRGDRCVVTREDFDQGYRAVANKLECSAHHEFGFYS